MTRRLLLLAALVALLLTGASPVAFSHKTPGADRPVRDTDLDPDFLGRARRVNPIAYDVDFSVVVTPPYKTKKLRVWLPLPPGDLGQEVEEGELSTFPLEVRPKIAAEPRYGNRFAYFEFPHPQGAQIIRHRFKVKVWELHWDVDPMRIRKVERWPSGFDHYLTTDQSVRVDEALRRQLRGIVPERRGPAEDLATVMRWANENLTYDHADASLRASARHALERRRGHCSDYHGLCAAFGRALGYPTRVVYGINPFPKNSPSHCKLEAFLPPYGWVSFDVSETQKLLGRIEKEPDLSAEKKGASAQAARERLLRGFRDNTWFLQTRGTDYELAPPASRRVPVVRTIYAEADGVALPEPDPANPKQREFAWMTAHRYRPDRVVTYPFEDWKSCDAERK